jgi:flavin-binding protein dodecin
MGFDALGHGNQEASNLTAALNGKAVAALLTLSLSYLIVFANRAPDNRAMSDHVYKKIELVGSSPNSIEEAVVNALARAQKTIRNMRWFEVTETRGHVEDGKINHWQVTVKVGFTLDK